MLRTTNWWYIQVKSNYNSQRAIFRRLIVNKKFWYTYCKSEGGSFWRSNIKMGILTVSVIPLWLISIHEKANNFEWIVKVPKYPSKIIPCGDFPFVLNHLHHSICLQAMEKEKKYKTFRSLIIHGTIGMVMEMGKGQKTHIQHIIKQIAQYTIINSSAHVYQLQLRRIH